jgi:hypothetical protein
MMNKRMMMRWDGGRDDEMMDRFTQSSGLELKGVTRIMCGILIMLSMSKASRIARWGRINDEVEAFGTFR